MSDQDRIEPPPRDVIPNDNPPVGTVGPNVSVPGSPEARPESTAVGGFGATHVLYPDWAVPGPSFPQAEAWDGWPVGWLTSFDNSGSAGGSAQAWTRRVDTVWACLDRNSGALSTFEPYLSKDHGRIPGLGWMLNPEPLAYSSWPAFMRQLVWLYQAAGEVFIVATSRYADSSGGYPQRFMCLAPWLVDVDGVVGNATYRIAGGDPIDPADVLHIKYLNLPGDLRGHGPLEAAGGRLLAAEALGRYGTGLAASGGLPPAVLKASRTLTAPQAARLKAQWINARRNSAGEVAVLDDDTDLIWPQTSPRDMLLRELQEFSESRIAVLLGVPPHLVGLPSGGDSLTYQTVAQMLDYHYRATLRVLAIQLSAALDFWLLPAGQHLGFDPGPYVAPPLSEQATTYQVLVDAGIVTVNEARTAMGWAAIPGHDTAVAASTTEPPQDTTGDAAA